MSNPYWIHDDLWARPISPRTANMFLCIWFHFWYGLIWLGPVHLTVLKMFSEPDFCFPYSDLEEGSSSYQSSESIILNPKLVMDISRVKEALAVKSFDNIADICDNLMLQVSVEGIPFRDDWPYAIHLLGYFYVDDCDSARFLWKTIPSSVKESKPEVVAAWRIGQKLWTRDYAGVYEAIRGYDWSLEVKDLVAAFSDVYTERMFQLLLSAYSTITIRDLALFLGMTEDNATTFVVENGWRVDATSQMVTVKKQAVKREQKVDQSKLQRLTEYVFHLEH